MYDVIVVGARCAGSPAAMLFARAGYRTLLLERMRFPADTLSTLYIHQPAVAQLARWGLLEAVKATGCPPLDRVVYQMGDIRLEGCSAGVDGIRAGYAPRRFLLDQILAEGATAAGAEFRDGCAVSGLVVEDGRVAGVRLSGPGGRTTVTERARLVVGADGMRSTIGRLAGAGELLSDPRLTCAYYTFWQGLSVPFELHEGAGGWVSTVPTNDATLVAAYFPQSEFESVRQDAWHAYLSKIRATAPGVSAQIAAAERTERLRGTGDQRNFFRQAHGRGWVLIGDAGHHKDSITARGISDAFLQVQLLADLVGEQLHDEEHLEAALRRFAAERDRMLLEGYQATLRVAQMTGQDQRRDLLTAIKDDPGLTTLYFDVFAGIRPVTDLYRGELTALR